jgi:hypothetical protein
LYHLQLQTSLVWLSVLLLLLLLLVLLLAVHHRVLRPLHHQLHPWAPLSQLQHLSQQQLQQHCLN